MTNTTTGATGLSPWYAILAGGGVAAIIDLAYAIGFARLAGAPAMVVPQAVASGVLGLAAFQGGGGSAALGVALHFAILLVAAACYVLASRRWAAVAGRPWPSGMLYGLAIYLAMHLVVLPLSLAPHFKTTPTAMAADLLVHVLLLGPAIALAAYRVRWTPVPAS